MFHSTRDGFREFPFDGLCFVGAAPIHADQPYGFGAMTLTFKGLVYKTEPHEVMLSTGLRTVGGSGVRGAALGKRRMPVGRVHTPRYSPGIGGERTRDNCPLSSLMNLRQSRPPRFKPRQCPLLDNRPWSRTGNRNCRKTRRGGCGGRRSTRSTPERTALRRIARKERPAAIDETNEQSDLVAAWRVLPDVSLMSPNSPRGAVSISPVCDDIVNSGGREMKQRA